MKRLLQRLTIATALLFAIGSPLRAQKLGVEDITPVYDLVKTFKRIIPYHDTASHLTVTHVFMNTDYRYVKLFLRYDPDQSITPQTQKQILDYLVHHDLWSLQPLADHTFDLRVELSIKDKPVSARYDYTTADLQNAISPPLEQLARDYIAQVVQTLQGDLPAQLDDDGQMLVASHYDTAARRVTNTYVFPDTVWPSVRERIVNHTDEVRRITAQNLLSGAAEGMASSAYLADVTLCYRYGNYSRTDSAEVFIAPWMWETYYKKGMDWLNWGKGDKAEDLFIKSIGAKTNYAPPHYQLALMDFEGKLYRKVLDTCVRIIADMNPDSDTRYGTIKLAEKVIYVYIDSVGYFIENKDVDGGFAMLSVCKDYCKRIKGIRRFEEFDKLSAQLYGAIHAKLVAQAREFYDAADLRQSTVFADSAASLRVEYPTFDIDATDESKLLNQLYVAWIAYGKKVSMDKPDEALFSFDQATHICRTHKAVNCTDELEKLAFDSRTHKYMQILTEAKSSLDDGYPDSALEQLDEAEKYRQTWELKNIALADELRVEAYQQKYDGLMCEGDDALNRKQPREALAFYAAALAINKSQPIVADTAWTTKLCHFSVKFKSAKIRQKIRFKKKKKFLR